MLSILLFTSLVGIWSVTSLFLLGWAIFLGIRWGMITEGTPFGGFWFCVLAGAVGFFMPFMTVIAYICVEIFKEHIFKR